MAFHYLLLISSFTLLGCRGPAKSFTDHVPASNQERIAFDMVYIPGDTSTEIEPFYIARTEVTWAMFLYWSSGEDLGRKNGFLTEEYAELVKADLRPSWVSTELFNRNRGLTDEPDRPAVSMSRLTARAYCKWVSEQTGRMYRLPTDAEWMHVLRLSGGVPADRDALLQQAVLADNAPTHAASGEALPAAVASKSPNRLGLYDLLGNAAEWIESEDERGYLRGGHFRLDANELTHNWRVEEDLAIWMQGWPGPPYSRFWYYDHYYQGIRLVCDIKPHTKP